MYRDFLEKVSSTSVYRSARSLRENDGVKMMVENDGALGEMTGSVHRSRRVVRTIRFALAGRRVRSVGGVFQGFLKCFSLSFF